MRTSENNKHPKIAPEFCSAKRTAALRNTQNHLLYVLFFLLFSPDTWRILIGFLAAIVIGPKLITGSSYSMAARVLIWLMILALGYVLSAPIGRFISKQLTAGFGRK